jgi:hypothetical protein
VDSDEHGSMAMKIVQRLYWYNRNKVERNGRSFHRSIRKRMDFGTIEEQIVEKLELV